MAKDISFIQHSTPLFTSNRLTGIYFRLKRALSVFLLRKSPTAHPVQRVAR
jgi:hypothetical protein